MAAWDGSAGRWLFWAPSLVNQGGSALVDYINSRGYLDFGTQGSVLQDGTGFWIKRP